ncbi:putative porin precursor [Prochlorococcus marinus str. PAC1]|uniref:Putative porin n=2 Tax=Prochlorococcus marinus TaxID=1219 RepID=A0A0A2C8S6_PROMR|nr:putative porin precursor [Prochlorococcus marinus str. PAC1]
MCEDTMKLFQRLLVAPAALGLMAPLAANADVSPVSTESDFSSEVIQARVDGLESQLGEVMAGQFSSSTKLSGKAAFITGYVDNNAATSSDEITFEYMYQLNLNTSFTGEDNLYTRIKSGNVGDASGTVGHFVDKGQGTYLSAANSNNNAVKVDKLWYQFPVGDSMTVWVGPKIENYYMLASAPSIYKPVTKQFALGGNGSAYGSSTSPGFGAAWTQEVEDPSAARWAVSANYSAKSGDNSAENKGLFGDDTESFVLTKVEYGSPRWQVSLATSFKEGWDNDGYYQSALATKSPNVAADSSMTAYAVRGYWRPETSGSVPEVQVGYDWATIDGAAAGEAEDTSGWMVGLGWKDLFIDGNRAGIALGSRQAATGLKSGGTVTSDPEEDNSVWEAYYTFKVNDGVSITPAIFGGSDLTNASGTVTDVDGAVLLTEFRF